MMYRWSMSSYNIRRIGKARPLQTRPMKSQTSSDVTVCLLRLLCSYRLLGVTSSSLQSLLIIYLSSSNVHAHKTWNQISAHVQPQELRAIDDVAIAYLAQLRPPRRCSDTATNGCSFREGPQSHNSVDRSGRCSCWEDVAIMRFHGMCSDSFNFSSKQATFENTAPFLRRWLLIVNVRMAPS